MCKKVPRFQVLAFSDTGVQILPVPGSTHERQEVAEHLEGGLLNRTLDKLIDRVTGWIEKFDTAFQPGSFTSVRRRILKSCGKKLLKPL